MKLESAHIKNFKLLKSVDLAFSVDEERPLTVIRAENLFGQNITPLSPPLGYVWR